MSRLNSSPCLAETQTISLRNTCAQYTTHVHSNDLADLRTVPTQAHKTSSQSNGCSGLVQVHCTFCAHACALVCFARLRDAHTTNTSTHVPPHQNMSVFRMNRESRRRRDDDVAHNHHLRFSYFRICAFCVRVFVCGVHKKGRRVHPTHTLAHVESTHIIWSVLLVKERNISRVYRMSGIARVPHAHATQTSYHVRMPGTSISTAKRRKKFDKQI